MENTYLGNAHLIWSEAYWTQPSVPGDGRYTNYQTAPDASFWDGIGVSDLIQAGADSIATSTPQYRFWDEDYPAGTVWEGPVVYPGDRLYAEVGYDGNNVATYFLEDATRGTWQSFKNSAPYVGYRAADFINEKLGPYLPHFSQSPAFSDCWTGDGVTNFGLTPNDNDLYYMLSSSGTLESQPSSVNYSQGFDVYWYNP